MAENSEVVLKVEKARQANPGFSENQRVISVGLYTGAAGGKLLKMAVSAGWDLIHRAAQVIITISRCPLAILMPSSEGC